MASILSAQQDPSTVSTTANFPHRHSISDASIRDNGVDEAKLLALAGNKIVLGEPGMGRSELMREHTSQVRRCGR
jgi:hypothetical protein